MGDLIDGRLLPGRLRQPLEVGYPRDGMVMSDYPLMLLDPAKRAASDRGRDLAQARRDPAEDHGVDVASAAASAR